MAKSVSQKVIKPSDYQSSDAGKPNKAIKVAERRKEHTCLADQVAQNITLVYINKLVEGLKKEFPTNSRMWCVRKYFPMAAHGELYVDEPSLQTEIAECLEKAVAMKKLGLRYIFIAPEMSIEEIVGQLES